MSFYKIAIALPRTVEMTVCARDERAARRAAWEFVSTAFANALQFWDYNEPIFDDEDQPLGEVQLEMSDEGMIELAPGAIEITELKKLQQ